MNKEQPYLILGAAGHIDHGKTHLIKNLTGINCDTLAEEKERGITINLGYAHFDLPGGVRLGVVDVPGHHRFIRTMVAGAFGIDLSMFVVAADDSVMPQTSEHLHILQLLGVKNGVIAMTKIDLMPDEEFLLAVEEDIRELTEGTFLENSPIIRVSNTTGEGLDDLAAALDEAAKNVRRRPTGERFRMPIDRSFIIKGAGTVVTGTILSGEVSAGDEIEVLPAGKVCRVRTIQVHGRAEPKASAGMRCAINLPGAEKEIVGRGQAACAPDSIFPTYMIDARLEILPGNRMKPFVHWSAVRLHVGTMEVTGKVALLDMDVMQPGQSGLAQIRVEKPLLVTAGDNFIIRNTSQTMTLGGGVILDAHPSKHKRRRRQAAEELASVESGELLSLILHEISKCRYFMSFPALARQLAESEQTLRKLLSESPHEEYGLLVSDECLTLPGVRRRIRSEIDVILKEHAGRHPLLAKGLSLDKITRRFESRTGVRAPQTLIRAAIEEGVEESRYRNVDDTCVIADRRPNFSEADRETIRIMRERFGDSLAPPQPAEYADELPVSGKRLKAIIESLLESGELVGAPDGFLFRREPVDRVRGELVKFLKREEKITVGDFRNLANTSRKYAIPLLQFYEDQGIVIRDGDSRRLPGRR